MTNPIVPGNWNRPLGALQTVLGLVTNVIHIRHPTTGKSMCDQTLLGLMPIGSVSPTDPALHDMCIKAWYEQKQM